MLVKKIDLHDSGLLEKYIESKKDSNMILSERQKIRIFEIVEKIKNHDKIDNYEKQSIRKFY